jgi:agmatine/peptidylarginine deiminase
LRSTKTDSSFPHCLISLHSIQPTHLRNEFAGDSFTAGYINFYVCNGAVIAPEFGDPKTDTAAKQKLQSLFPKREVIQLNIDGIAGGGGGIHCTTQQEPKGYGPVARYAKRGSLAGVKLGFKIRSCDPALYPRITARSDSAL